MPTPSHITLIGCGKMGSALLQGWIDNDINAAFSIIDPNDIPFQNIDHFRTPEDAASSLKTADTIILAIKPQIMRETCAALSPHISPHALILSIAAGQSLTTLQTYFNQQQPIIRAMPNTPAAIGKGMSVAVANQAVVSTQKNMTETLLKSAGKLEWLDDENLMDAVTAVSGSGPAYLFHMIEILTQSAEQSGLSKEMSATLARQTIIGAAALAESESSTEASTLRKNVTSPGGTTQAALETLMDGRAQKIFDETINAAVKRSKELG